MALGIGYGLPFIAQHGSNPYKTQWAAAQEGAKAAGATVEDENAGVGSCLVSRGQEAYTAGLPSTPSLLIVPQFYKSGNLYQDIPPFVAEDSTMRFTVTRATTATRVNSSGNIESVASGVPRIDWLGQSCPALLVEPSAQNLALQSEDFTVSGSWDTSANGRTLVTGNVSATLDPYNTNLADLLSDNTSTSATHRMFTGGNIAITSGTTYSTSFFVKANTTPWLEIRLMQSNESDAGISGTVFNLTSGTITSGSGTIQNYGNGWYRCTNIGTSNFTGNAKIFFYVYNSSGSKSYIGTSSNSLFIFGAQVEVGSVATTYIPTTSGSASRNADQITASGALVSGLIGQSVGTIYVDITYLGKGTGSSTRWLQIFGASDNIGLGILASDRVRSIVNGQTDTITTVLTTSGIKIAWAYDASGTVCFINGTQYTLTNGGNQIMSSLTSISIDASAISQLARANIRAAALYTTRLTNSQLEQLTKP